jgi:hypothetical protein
VGDHPSAQPQSGDALTEGLHDTGDLAAGDRGKGGKLGQGAPDALAQGGVEEMDARGRHGDTDLAGARHRVVDLLEGQVPGRTEGVQTDGMHDGLPVCGFVGIRLSDLELG